MTMKTPAHPSDPRLRAAQTKRDRTRTALIAAADAAFTARGWSRTRVEDIASAAGVSAATAYNHFPTKHALIGAVFAPHVRTLIVQAEQDVARDRPVVEALVDQVHALVRLSFRNRGLVAAFTSAVLEYTIRTGRAPDPQDPGDPRAIAPVPDALRVLVLHGQRTGRLRTFPAATEISAAMANLLLIRGLNRQEEPPEATADLLLTLLFGALCPELVAGNELPLSRS